MTWINKITLQLRCHPPGLGCGRCKIGIVRGKKINAGKGCGVQTHAQLERQIQRGRQYGRVGRFSDRRGHGRLQLFLNARFLAFQLAQIVELGTTHSTAALHADIVNARTIGLKHTLHTLAVRYLAHSEG